MKYKQACLFWNSYRPRILVQQIVTFYVLKMLILFHISTIEKKKKEWNIKWTIFICTLSSYL